MPNPPSSFTFRVDHAKAGVRLDALVAAEIDYCSRSYAATLIRKGCIVVDGSVKKPGYPVKAGEAVCGAIEPPELPPFLPESIPIDILYEDGDLLIVNKVPGMVVHPAPGHSGGTLVNALMHHCPDLVGISGSRRPGIVHRLDKDTSGALVVAKNTGSMHGLAAQFKARTVRKRYLALVYGIPIQPDGRVDLPIGRHPVDRKKMSIHSRSPRSALTRWRVAEKFQGVCLLQLDLHTGRTHQIRVHCKAMGHPVIGDPVYGQRGAKNQLAQGFGEMARVVGNVDRQLLHASRITIQHPRTGESICVQAPMPPDMTGLIERFRRMTAENGLEDACHVKGD